jgi:hypothetical protein
MKGRTSEAFMKFLHWLGEELRTVLAATLYFAACFVTIMILKQLLLAQYGIEFNGITTAIVVALVTAKVIVVMEKVPLNRWLHNHRPVYELVARTALYTFATMLALLLEKAFEARHEYDGFGAAIGGVFGHRDIPQVWATIIFLCFAFLAYNAFGILRREIGGSRLRHIFFARPAMPR